MDSFELNKVLGAVLGTCLFLLAVHIASGAIFTPVTPAKPGYEIAVPEAPAGGGAPAAPADVPIESMLPSASIKQGAADVKVCEACHTFHKGQATMSAQIFTASSAARSRRLRASTTRQR